MVTKSFPIGSSFTFLVQESGLIIENEYKQLRTDQDVTLLVELQMFNFSQAETQTLQQILSVENTEILFTVRMESPNQLKLVQQQLKALRTDIVCIEIEPLKNQHMAWYYDPSAKQQMKYLFSNFNIETSCEDETKFYYNGKELVQSLNLLDKENQITLLIKSSGTLIIKQFCPESVTYSVLKNTVQNDLI